MSGLWCVNMGYGQQSIINAVNNQMKELVYYNNFFGTSHPSAIKLSEMITDLTPEGDPMWFSHQQCGVGVPDTDLIIYHPPFPGIGAFMGMARPSFPGAAVSCAIMLPHARRHQCFL